MNSIAIGSSAGTNSQNANNIAIGNNAGTNNQNLNSVAIGNSAGYMNQNANNVAIGNNAGNFLQKIGSVSIGNYAGYYKQQSNSVAIGNSAGFTGQSDYSIAIGYNAGYNNQSNNSIAIGTNAGVSGCSEHSIILSASSIPVTISQNPGFFVSPISKDSESAGITGGMYYNSTTSEICYSPSKTFVIDHPIHSDKYLVHACLEGPEAGVYYRGKSKITNNDFTIVELPYYVSSFANELSVQVTCIYEKETGVVPLAASEIENNCFKVYGKNTAFWWVVFGKRSDVNVEPNKRDVEVKGQSPYLWL
jgi:hypothetical protein